MVFCLICGEYKASGWCVCLHLCVAWSVHYFSFKVFLLLLLLFFLQWPLGSQVYLHALFSTCPCRWFILHRETLMSSQHIWFPDQSRDFKSQNNGFWINCDIISPFIATTMKEVLSVCYHLTCQWCGQNAGNSYLVCRKLEQMKDIDFLRILSVDVKPSSKFWQWLIGMQHSLWQTNSTSSLLCIQHQFWCPEMTTTYKVLSLTSICIRLSLEVENVTSESIRYKPNARS